MGKIGKQVANLVGTLILALMIFGTFAQRRVSAQSQQLHAAPPGGSKQSLKARFLWPVKPFRVIGNIYYVGLSSFDAYLITTPKGHFMVDVSIPKEVRKNVEDLGFKVADIKYILEEHAHNDHVYGISQMKEWSGAKVLSLPGDVPTLEDGAFHENFLPDMEGPIFTPVKVDRVIRDGEKIELGGTTMVAHLTAGHTAGCTTWTTDVEENGKKYSVAIYGSCASLNNPLVGNKDRPNIAEDYVNQYKTLRSLHVDVPLGIEKWEEMNEKVEMREKNPNGPNPFINPKQWDDFVAKNAKIFEDQWAKEKAGGGAYPIVVGGYGKCPPNVRACYDVADIILDCCAKIGAKYVGKD